MQPELTADQLQALEQSHGFVDGPTYILMSRDVFCDLMGIGSNEDYQASLAAIEEAVQDIEKGHSRPLKDFLREFDERHGIHH